MQDLPNVGLGEVGHHLLREYPVRNCSALNDLGLEQLVDQNDNHLKYCFYVLNSCTKRTNDNFLKYKSFRAPKIFKHKIAVFIFSSVHTGHWKR